VKWEVKQGDRAKPLRARLQDEDGYPDLSDKDVWFVMENTVGSSGNIARILTPDADAEKGWASVVWVEPELDVVGVFKAAFRMFDPTLEPNGQETFPNDDYISVIVNAGP
jgi:hypothetical protein